nr:MAG TPA: hypothetical protein [Caudoviricetes sp.]
MTCWAWDDERKTAPSLRPPYARRSLKPGSSRHGHAGDAPGQEAPRCCRCFFVTEQ